MGGFLGDKARLSSLSTKESITMKTCTCSLPYLDPKACDSCAYNEDTGYYFIPYSPELHDFEIHDDRYIIIKKKIS